VHDFVTPIGGHLIGHRRLAEFLDKRDLAAQVFS
jgi:hypothetical protein